MKKANEMKQNAILTQTEYFAKVCDGLQKKFYEQQLQDFHEVKCVKLSDIFTNDEVRTIKMVVNPKKKECYRNAHLLTALFPDRAQYVEGQVAIFNGAFGVEHAWNKVDGKYIDLTFEIALGEDPTKELYMALGEYNLNTITMVTSETGYYGSIYNQRFINANKSN